jgi:hypothetical protein
MSDEKKQPPKPGVKQTPQQAVSKQRPNPKKDVKVRVLRESVEDKSKGS